MATPDLGIGSFLVVPLGEFIIQDLQAELEAIVMTNHVKYCSV
jgi:hypothetical protein